MPVCSDSQVARHFNRWYWCFTPAYHKTRAQWGGSVFTEIILQAAVFKKPCWFSFVTERDLLLYLDHGNTVRQKNSS